MTDLKNRIKDYMSEYRYKHTLSVAKECECLAELFGIDAEKLVYAAYLHDITKEMSVADQLDLCADFGVTLDDSTLNSPKTMHSFTAPLLIKKDFPEYAESIILDAVAFHTTGKADMNIYEKLLYLADYIEPTRKFDDCITLRKFFYASTDPLSERLDRTIILSLKYTVSDLLEKNAPIHEKTIEAYNFLLSRIGDQNG